MLLISDANILIDMIEGGLIDHMFQLPEEFHVPDILFIEELQQQHQDLLDKGLRIKSMSGDVVMEAYRLRLKYKKPGQNDLNALALAKIEGYPLLTGDWDLREAAQAENVELKGTLWLVERMYKEKLISKKQATEAYGKMQDANRRLPWDKVKAQLKRFK